MWSVNYIGLFLIVLVVSVLSNHSKSENHPGMWSKRRITYGILNCTQTINATKLRYLFDEALEFWTQGIDLSVEERNADGADIQVSFTYLDGPGNYLGYAYFPNDGDIFIDAGENWSFDEETGMMNIQWVVIHELGHSFGLDHSDNPESVMYPYYQNFISFNGSREDRRRLENIYGAEITGSNNTLLCQNKTVDALVTTENQDIILIQKDKYWTLSRTLKLKNGPFSITSLFPDLGSPIGAAFSTRGDTTYLLENEFVHKYTKDVGKRGKIALVLGSLPSNISAAFYHRKTKKIYCFKGSTFFVVDTKIKSLKKRIQNYDILSYWKGVPTDIEAATMLDDDRVLIIVGSGRYFIYNIPLEKTEEDGDLFADIVKCV